jgi:heme-degrading monooxygenase HmoA
MSAPQAGSGVADIIRVLVYANVRAENAEAFEEAFSEVSSRVKGTPGHVSDELLRDAEDPDTYILLGQWRTREAFLEWENDPIHREATTPMRPYWSVTERRIFEVAVQPV